MTAPRPPAAPLRLRIDSLALHGVPSHHAPALRDALQTELARLLSAADPARIAAPGGAALRLEAPAGGSGDPAAMGRQAARALARSLTGGGGA